MQTNERLLALAEQKGYEVIYAQLENNSSFAVEVDTCLIAVAKNLSRINEKERLAHELGHCEYGGFYNRHSHFDIRAKAERRADKWAYYKLVPPGAVVRAMTQGVREPWELAEAFDVSCEYMQGALDYYRSVMAI